jgi:fructose/tagatose bisphosphate aldolase
MGAAYTTLDELQQAWNSVGTINEDGTVTITDEGTLRETVVDNLVWTGVFAEDTALRDAARWLVRAAANATGNVPASIHDLYIAYGKGETPKFTVPAINIRAMTYDFARQIFKAGAKRNGGAILCEIARSEIGYTEQRPAEYATSVLGAAIKEGWNRPVFIQGDHFQIKAANFHKDAKSEREAVEALIKEGIEAGFYNIDVDTSTLVTLEPETLDAQQKLNYKICAILTDYIRAIEPNGVTVSVGGEIGEIGTENSTVPELEAFMDGYVATKEGDRPGISKISVQTGTSHGGVPLPDGTIAEVALDFDTLEQLGKVSQEKYGLGGAVQHGASTLPKELFDRFPQLNTVEIHLATGFQNIIYDHDACPTDLKEKVYAHLREAHADEKKDGQTDAQFIYKTRKKGFGPFKAEWWNLPAEAKDPILQSLFEEFDNLFGLLAIDNTSDDVAKWITPVDPPQAVPEVLSGAIA